MTGQGAPDPREADVADAQAAYDRAHGGNRNMCLPDPCPWHPAPETRLRPTAFGPAVLVEGEPSLVVFDVAGMALDAAVAQDTADPADGLGAQTPSGGSATAVDDHQPSTREVPAAPPEGPSVEAVLEAHARYEPWSRSDAWDGRWTVVCTCGEERPGDDAMDHEDFAPRWHRAHVAAMLAARQRPTAPPEDRVTAADAWDKGYSAGQKTDVAAETQPSNPYRAAREDAS